MRSFRRAALVALILGAAIPVAAQTPKRPPRTYGTTAVSYVSIPAEEFSPLDSSYSYTLGTYNTARYSSNCGGAGVFCFGAPLHLPSGAKLVSLELVFDDTNGIDFTTGTLVECNAVGMSCSNHPTAPGGPPDCSVPGEICSGAVFASGRGSQVADLTPDDLTIDNLNNSYRLWAGFTRGTSAEQIVGMIVGYVLQVSPPPVDPTFNDVPPAHPFYQYIEALAASGVTGGCGGGNYCPDSPITRGQMAVFLAKALGLQWP